MAHIVTCQICHKKFDRDKEPFKKIASRKYVHQSCYDNANKNEKEIIQDQKDLDELFKYCEKLVGKEKFNFLATQKYFQKLKSDPDKVYTYTGMLRTLHWYYEVKGHTPDESAVGIIPYAYDDANRYYYNIWLITQMNAPKIVKGLEAQAIDITIPEPKVIKKKSKNFSFLDEDKED